MAVGTMLTRGRFLEYPMRNRLIRTKKARTGLALCILGTVVSLALALGCSDTGSALIDMRLEIYLIAANGSPVEATKVYFKDHDLPRRQKSNGPQEAICTSDEAGRCAARVRYRYSITTPQWLLALRRAAHSSKVDPLIDRFELLVPSNGNLQRLSFLPPPSPLELHGFETIEVLATVPASIDKGEILADVVE